VPANVGAIVRAAPTSAGGLKMNFHAVGQSTFGLLMNE